MANKKNPADQKEDIIKYINLAISTEKRGIKFYSEAKKKVSDYNLTRLMDVLLDQERIHLKAFQTILSAEKKKGTEQAAKVAAKYHKQKPIRNPMFDLKHAKDLSDLKTDIYNMFKIATDFEQKGHDMYLDMAKKIKNKNISAFLKKVAEEETKHKKFIEEHNDAIYDTGYWLGLEHVRLQT